MGKSERLVVLPGWSHGADAWQSVLEVMPEARVQELPGFGDEPLLSDAWGVPEYALWAAERLAAAPKSVILLGHSFGGRVASLIASERPEWLAGLILYGAPCLYRPEAATRAKVAAAKLLKPLKSLLPKGTGGNPELADADARGLGPIFRRTVPFDQTDMLPKIAVPTLLLWGEQDASVPLRIAEEMRGLIPGSTLTVIPNAGHNAHLENPVLFTGIVARYLETLP